jgi:hypothetical protein
MSRKNWHPAVKVMAVPVQDTIFHETLAEIAELIYGEFSCQIKKDSCDSIATRFENEFENKFIFEERKVANG